MATENVLNLEIEGLTGQKFRFEILQTKSGADLKQILRDTLKLPLDSSLAVNFTHGGICKELCEVLSLGEQMISSSTKLFLKIIPVERRQQPIDCGNVCTSIIRH